MEAEMRSFLTTVPSVFASGPDFLRRLIDGSRPPESEEESCARLRASFLSVRGDSCYGNLHIYSLDMVSATREDCELTDQLCGELMKRGLCSSILLRRGCERKGFFGTRFSSAIVASPDFAKLAVLKRLELLDVSRLGIVVETLVPSAKHERYCENKWQALLAECKADPRFVPVIARSRR